MKVYKGEEPIEQFLFDARPRQEFELSPQRVVARRGRRKAAAVVRVRPACPHDPVCGSPGGWACQKLAALGWKNADEKV